jgi:transposase
MRDARSLSNQSLETLRWRAVTMVGGGATQVATANALGVHKNTVSLWLKWWREGGDAALKPKRGAPRRLSAATEGAIQRVIANKYPDQLELLSPLWTRMTVHALIATHFGISLDYSTTVKYLRRWGLTPRRPSERQDPEIRRWIGREYPKIAARAKAEGANISWAQVTRISDQRIPGRTAQRNTTSMISTIADRGRIWFMLHEGAVNAPLFTTFLERLDRIANGKIFLIVDNVIADHVKDISEWLAKQRKVELFLPREHDGDMLPTVPRMAARAAAD